MSGFVHDPLQIINLIADNVRDRYRDETAVLKEIVQNADDAEADRADFIVVCDGIPTARNRLLQGPALVAVNNGRFRRRDARGIRQFGLSVKSADHGAIGKFGLGQKAVFYLCEAFLYCAEGVLETEDPKFPYRGVINPWSEVATHQSLFPDWDGFDDDDLALVRRALMPLGEFSRRFILWLPLRSELQLTHGNGRIDPIVSHYPNPKDLVDRLCSSTVLAECLPMLAHLEVINVHHVEPATGWRTLATCALPKNVDRLRRGDSTEEQGVELSGRVAIDRNVARTALDFVGYQKIQMTDTLRLIKNNEAWPAMHLRDEDGLKAIHPKEKASKPEGSTLNLDWAVFLPVGERQREQFQLSAADGQTSPASSFQLVLHGYFFLDAGRQSIEAITDPLLSNLPANEADVRRAWNTTVRDELILPNVPAVVAAAAQILKLTHAEVWSLCDAVRKTRVWTRHTKTITSHTSFVCELHHKGSEWRLVNSETVLRPLPRPPTEERDRPWTVLPGLTEFQDDHHNIVLVANDAPHLTTHDALIGWRPEEVTSLIATAPITIFSRRAHVIYLATFLDAIPGVARNSAVGIALFELLRKVLSAEGGAGVLTARGQAILPLLAHIPRNRLLFLPERAAVPEVLSHLNSAILSLLILPSSLEPQGFANTMLDASIAQDLLAALHSLIETAGDAVADAASRAAAEILSRADRHIIELINSPHFGRLRVFRVRSWKSERTVSVSYENLILAQRESRLFLTSPGETLPRLLQQVLVDCELLSIDRETAASISLNCSPVSAESSLIAISRAGRLAPPGPRSRLLEQIRAYNPINTRMAFRFLCHGEATAKSNTAPLFRANTSELGELLRSLLHRRGESWRVLSEEISDALTGELARALGVENRGDSEIAQQLSESSDEDLALTRNMSGEAKRRLLLSVQDRVTWRRLPLHSFVDGATGPLGINAFLQSDYPLQAMLAGTVRLVRPSVDANVAAQQSKFVEPWGPHPLLATALEQSDPHRFMNPILDALDTTDQPSPELTDHLRRKPWLALASGPTRPEDILDLRRMLLSRPIGS